MRIRPARRQLFAGKKNQIIFWKIFSILGLLAVMVSAKNFSVGWIKQIGKVQDLHKMATAFLFQEHFHYLFSSWSARRYGQSPGLG